MSASLVLHVRDPAYIPASVADIEQVSLSGWRRAIGKCHLDADFYAHRRWDVSQKLPWDVVDSGTKPEKLVLELKRALHPPDGV